MDEALKIAHLNRTYSALVSFSASTCIINSPYALIECVPVLVTVLFPLVTRFTVTNDPNPSSIHSHSLLLHDPLYRLQLSESLSSLSLISPLQFISA